jgi:vitamin B12 transporter
LDNAHRLIISRGTGFKAPTFNDLYWPASPWSAGNEDLLPEESVSTELELRGRYDSLSWTLSAYRNEIKNLIDWAETRAGFWQPSNIDSAKIVGSELSIATTLGEWNLNVAASYAKPEDELTGRLLARRAKKSIAAQIQRQYNELSVGLNIKSQSHRFDDSANTERLAGYGILGVRLAYVFSKKITGNLALDNILNKDYQLSNDYETSGSSALISINYKM